MMDVNAIMGVILNILVFVVVAGLVVGSIAGAIYWIKKRKMYMQYDIVIFKKDNFGNIHKEKDWGGIFTDKLTGNKRFYLRKNKGASLNPDYIRPVPQKKSHREVVYLFQTGLKNFSILNMKIDPNDNLKVKLSEQDVNWGLAEWQRLKARHENQGLKPYIGFIGLVIFGILIMITLVFAIKTFGGEFSKIGPMLSDMKDISHNLMQAHTGTAVQ